MTVQVILVDPPREGVVLPYLAETSPLSTEDAVDVYTAMVQDTVLASWESGGETLVNYRDSDDFRNDSMESGAVEAELRDIIAPVLDDAETIRYEVQVGSSVAARAGNTVTHLLEEEDADDVAVIDPRAPTISRRVLDGAAMKLRSSDIVVGPGSGGRVPYLGLTQPLDFHELYDIPEIATIARRGTDANRSVDFLDPLPVVETGTDLATVLAIIEARLSADRWVPPFTAATITELELSVVEKTGSRTITRD